MQVLDVMLSKVFRCLEDDSVQMCAVLMLEQNIGFVPIVSSDGSPVGVITDRDLALRVLASGRPATTPVSEVMTGGKMLTCHREDDLRALEERMANEQKSRAMVVDDEGRLIGIVSLSDIAQRESSPGRTAHLVQKLTRRQIALQVRE